MDENPSRVLLVEDDVEVAGAVTRRLRQLGFEVVATPTCGSALALTCCFDIGVFDVELTDGNGAELAAIMHRDQQVLHVVFFTASDFAPLLSRAEDLGPVVRKSEGLEALLPVITGVSGRARVAVSGIVPAGGEEAETDPITDRKRQAG